MFISKIQKCNISSAFSRFNFWSKSEVVAFNVCISFIVNYVIQDCSLLQTMDYLKSIQYSCNNISRLILEIVQIYTRKLELNRITKILNNFQVIASFRKIKFPWQLKNMHTFHKLLTHFWGYPVTGYIS